MADLWPVQLVWHFWSVARCWKLSGRSCLMLGHTNVWPSTWLELLRYFTAFRCMVGQALNRRLLIISLYKDEVTCQHPFVFVVPPSISSRGGTVTVVVNEAARLECEAAGVPLPILTWLKDGSPVASVSHGIQVLTLVVPCSSDENKELCALLRVNRSLT